MFITCIGRSARGFSDRPACSSSCPRPCSRCCEKAANFCGGAGSDPVVSPMPQVATQICARCLMDRSDPNIDFDPEGVCSHCQSAATLLPRVRPSDQEADEHLQKASAAIRTAGRDKAYDCVVGISGGVDSSYTALIAKRMGLRTLLVHFDNGWDSELAVENIQRIVEALQMELMTYVVDWAEFRDLQRAFLKASVLDLELPSDNAIVATMLKTARDQRVPYVLMGANIATEHGLPAAWTWLKTDWTNIRAIQRAYGTLPLRTFPHVTTFEWGLIRVLGI